MARRVGRSQNDIPQLPSLPDTRYENIFKMYETETDEQYFFFNVLNTVFFPDNLDPDIFRTVVLQKRQPWTIISYQEYGTMDLWWMIVLVNKIFNPVAMPPAGTRLKIVKNEFVKSVIDDIKRQL